MHSQNARLKSTTLQLMAVAFLGIHVPMIGLILHGLVNGFTGMLWILLTVLVATGLSTVVSLVVIHRLMRGIASDDTGLQMPQADQAA